MPTYEVEAEMTFVVKRRVEARNAAQAKIRVLDQVRDDWQDDMTNRWQAEAEAKRVGEQGAQ